MSALRRRDESVTLLAEDGSTYLFPLQKHDFEASKALNDSGLQIGEVVYDSSANPVAVRYPESSDLVRLTAVLNGSQGVDGGQDDIDHAFELSRTLFHDMYARLRAVPHAPVIDTIAIDKDRDRVELLPPFEVDSSMNPDEATEELLRSALDRSITVSEQGMITSSFRRLRGTES